MNMNESPGQFMQTVAEILAGDSTLQGWCQQELGRQLNVQVGADENNPPSVDTYPVVVLVNCVEERGDQRKPVFILSLGCGIYNETITTLDNLKIYSGLIQAADLGNQVEQAVIKAGLGTVEVIGEEIPISFHPIHVTNTAIRCELIKSSRRPGR